MLDARPSKERKVLGMPVEQGEIPPDSPPCTPIETQSTRDCYALSCCRRALSQIVPVTTRLSETSSYRCWDARTGLTDPGRKRAEENKDFYVAGIAKEAKTEEDRGESLLGPNSDSSSIPQAIRQAVPEVAQQSSVELQRNR